MTLYVGTLFLHVESHFGLATSYKNFSGRPWAMASQLKNMKLWNIGKKNDDVITFKYSMTEDGNKFDMTRVNEMKDIGVIVDSGLKFDKHINSKIKTANKVLGIIRRSFLYLSADILIPLYKVLVRSHFDYAMIIWNPHLVKHIESIEGVPGYVI